MRGINHYIDWSTDTEGALARSEHAGLMGNVILERFRVLVDFKNGVLYLNPEPNQADPFVSNIAGMSSVYKSGALGAIVVTGLFEGGNAEKAGLKPGDRIFSIL